MSVLRYIAILSIIGTMIFKSSFGTVVPTDGTGNGVNSIEELMLDEETNITMDKDIEVNDEMSSLIAAHSEYKNSDTGSVLKPGFIVNPFREGIENTEVSYTGENLGQVETGKFIEGEKSTKIQIKKKTRKQKKITSARGSIGVNMNIGTSIETSLGELIDPTSIDISSVSGDTLSKVKEYNKKRAKKTGLKKESKKQEITESDSTYISDTFEFGIPGKHLIFSRPVALTVDTPLYSDGTSIDIAVLHAGDTEFNTSGLSTSANTLCNSNGTASIAGSQAIVKNGKITFYTCGASSFTMNPSGGVTGSNDLRIVIGDCAQIQLYYNNQSQIYTGNPPASGCSTNSTMDAWPVLRIGTISYGNDFTAWTTSTTTGSTNGNTYTATSTMTAINGGRTYTLIIDWSHSVPNKYFTWSYRVIIPTGNTQNVRFYYGMDSAVAGADANDVGYFTNTGGQTVGIYDNVANVMSAFRYLNGPTWTGYQANGWNTVRTQIANGANFTNNVQATGGDLGFGINWDFGTAAATYSGAVEWRVLPYTTANTVDLIPGIGQPEGPLTTTYLSQMPITITNAGNLTSSGVHTTVLTLPINISGPGSSFTDNGWSCGAQVGSTVTCTKTTTISSLGSETFRIPVIPQPAASGATLVFTGTISNPGDSNVTNNTAFASNSVVAGSIAYAPGGVAGMTFWVKANGNKNCSATGCTITSWSNSGSLGTAANAITGLGTVTYDPATQINYNPTLYFNNAALNTNNNLSITGTGLSLFTITKLGTGGIFRVGPQTAVTNSLDWSTLPTLDRVALYNGSVFYNNTNQRSIGSMDMTTTIRASNGTITNRTDGLQTMTNASILTPFVATNIGIGRTVNTTSAFANVGEIIIYPITLTTTERNKVESYLAIKYGNTLNQTTPQNYTLSNNLTIWDSSIAGVFNKNIAGIARDDTSALNQIKSQSNENSGDITVNAISAFGMNYKALTWGNDGNSINSYTTTDTKAGYQRINREWQFQEKSGDVGTIKIAYPVASLPAGAINPLYILVDDDSIFATGSTVYTGSLNGGNWEFTIPINDMQYITFAKAGDTVAPNILSNSKSSGSLLPIGNFPITIVYSDTGSNINISSFTGKIYAWDGVSAWNSTNIAPSYMTITGTTTTSTGNFMVSDLPFGKYRFDITIADNDGNLTTQSYTYFVDAIEWSISSAEYDIGNIIANTQVFGTGNMVVTVKTVGAPFSIKVTGSNTLAYGPATVGYWDGFEGWGYDTGGGNLGNPSSGITVANQVQNLNQNGLKNTYTYNLKYGANLSNNMIAGIYNGTVKLDLIVNY